MNATSPHIALPAATADIVLSVNHLCVQVATPSGGKTVLDDMTFALRANEVLCLAGESGSGKSMTALAIMGLLPRPMARITAGSIALGDLDITHLPERRMREVRAARIAMIFQEPMTALNPVMTIGTQLLEVLRAHQQAGASNARKRVLELLEQVRISAPAQRLSQYPHELSGGMRQRVMIAMALACQPEVLIADEPTTALDVTVQAQILDLIETLQKETGTAVLLITHDMGVVAETAHRVIVMQQGHTVEQADVQHLFKHPGAPYTRTLLDAVPRLGASGRGATSSRPSSNTGHGNGNDTGNDNAINNSNSNAANANKSSQPSMASVAEVDQLSVRFPVRGGWLNRVVEQVHAVEQVSFRIAPGETLALVGESGSGKSTIGKALLSLVPFSGTIHIDGTATACLSRRAMRPLREHVQMIFQDPYASLDPRQRVASQVAEPLVVHGLASGTELQDRVEWLFQRVGLSADQMSRHPHEFSGGQRQRVCIARALALKPKLIVADECVSALDVSVQAQVLELLLELQHDQGIAYLFISHDMAVVEQVSHRVAVLYAGQIVELGSRAQVLGQARHTYTQRLLSAVPIPDPDRRRPPFVRASDHAPRVHFPMGEQPGILHLQDQGNGHWVAD